MSYKQLTLKQRYEIRALLQAGTSKNRIAELIGVHKSTVYRELGRNQGAKGYDPELAQARTDVRWRDASKAIRFTEDVKEQVDALLRLDFSPEQVSGYLEKEKGIRISHETIYQHVYADHRAGGDLYKHLRWSRKKRRKRLGKKDRRGQIPDRVSIDQRPDLVNAKVRIGDWEVDTMIGKNHKGVLITAVERKTMFSCIGHVPQKRADLVENKLVEMLSPFQGNVLTITTDNGKEFTNHKSFSKRLEVDVYFAHPYSSWERGLNENINGLIRQYFPKRMSFLDIKEQDVKFVENRLNQRPRKSLNFRTPKECFLTVALGT